MIVRSGPGQNRCGTEGCSEIAPRHAFCPSTVKNRDGKPWKCETHYRISHGHSIGTKRSPEYRAWAHMRQRCVNPNDSRYNRYGARGISVCDRWNEFESFIADVGNRPSENHSIDRIDNNGNCEPGNVRWSTKSEQMRNTSRSVHSDTVNWIRYARAISGASCTDIANSFGMHRLTVGDVINRRGRFSA